MFYGWVVVFVATLGVCFSIPGQTMGFAVFTDLLMDSLGLSRVQLSSAYFVGTVLSGLTLPALGRLFDRIGARRMTFYSAIATGLVLFFLAQVDDLAARLTQLGVPAVAASLVMITLGFYLIRASAQGVLTMTCRNAIGKWFDYHRGNALAVSGVATAFAFSAAPLGLRRLNMELGHEGTWILLGATTILVMGGLGWLLMRDNPEECALVMDGKSHLSAGRKPHADSIAHRDFTRAEALRTRAFWTFNLTFSFWSLFSTAYTFHLQSIAAEAGRDFDNLLAWLIPTAVLSVAVSLLCGWLSPRIRLRHLLSLMNFGILVAVLGTLRLDSDAGLVCWVVGSGVTSGCFAALTGIAWPRFFGRRHLGAISGFGMSSMVVASGIGPLLLGASKGAFGSYQVALWAGLAIPLILLFLSFSADNPQSIEGRRGGAKED